MIDVLVVEDNEDLLDLLVDALESAGVAAAPASTALEAIDLLERGAHPRLVLADEGLPGMSGTELFETMRSRGCGASFLLMTGDRKDHGHIPTIRKPFEMREVIDHLSMLTGDRV